MSYILKKAWPNLISLLFGYWYITIFLADIGFIESAKQKVRPYEEPGLAKWIFIININLLCAYLCA